MELRRKGRKKERTGDDYILLHGPITPPQQASEVALCLPVRRTPARRFLNQLTSLPGCPGSRFISSPQQLQPPLLLERTIRNVGGGA